MFVSNVCTLLVCLSSLNACFLSLPPPTLAQEKITTGIGPLIYLGRTKDRTRPADVATPPDRIPDLTFRIHLRGELTGLALISSDAQGRRTPNLCWDTFIETTPIPASLGVPFTRGEQTWGLIVMSEDERILNPQGHFERSIEQNSWVTLYMSENPQSPLQPGHSLTLLVLRPNGQIERSTTTIF